jgi:hypothetical protein
LVKLEAKTDESVGSGEEAGIENGFMDDGVFRTTCLNKICDRINDYAIDWWNDSTVEDCVTKRERRAVRSENDLSRRLRDVLPK